MNYAGFLDLAEERGYVVVTPLGYTRRGGYGYRGDSEQDRRAEQDDDAAQPARGHRHREACQ